MDELRRQQYLKLMGVSNWQCKIARPELIVAAEIDINTVPNVDVMPDAESTLADSVLADLSLNTSAVSGPVVSDSRLNEAISNNINHQGLQEGVQKEPQKEIPSWQGLQSEIQNCQLCELHQSRQQALIGEGNQQADVVFIGEAPSHEDDQNTQIISGEAGQLFDAMLKAIGLDRQAVYLLNLLKCTLPDAREPFTSELLCCEKYLQQQLSLLQPKVIYAMGSAANHLLLNQQSLSMMRRRAYRYNGIPVVVSLSPWQLLKNPADKRKAWQDLLQLKKMF